MIPASAYATGPSPYYFEPAAKYCERAQVNHELDDLYNGFLKRPVGVTTDGITPGVAIAFDGTVQNGDTYQPIYGVTSITPTFTAANFAGFAKGDLYNSRSNTISNAVDPDASVVQVKYNTFIPRAVYREWWVPVDTLTGLLPNTAVNIITAAGATQGYCSPTAAGNVALATSVVYFEGRTCTNDGQPFAVVRFPVPLSR
jgi:hypothetical protein